VERAACAHCPITAAISAGGVACFTAVNHFVVQTISVIFENTTEKAFN